MWPWSAIRIDGEAPGWQVAIDHDAGILQIEAHTTGVRTQEQPAIRIVAEGDDFRPTALLLHGAGVPCIADPVLIGPCPDFFQHAHPLGEDNNFCILFAQRLVEDAGQFVHHRTVMALAALHDVRTVTNHAQHIEQEHEQLLFFLGERAALCL